MAGKFYAVRVGRTPGIYNSWDDCKAQTDGFPNATYKSFKTAAEAAEFMGWGESSASQASINSVQPSQTFAGQASTNQGVINQATSLSNDDTQIALDNVAYVDGSYNVATGEFSYGVVMFHNGEEHTFSKAFSDPELATMRNVAGEIKGAEAAMEYAYKNGMKSLTIYHDYEGISKWPLRLWAANKEGTKAYQQYYDEIKKSVDVKFVKVKGHSGDKYNDLADKLAKEALGIV